MERYLDIYITEQNKETTVEQILKKQARLTRKQISQAKFRADGIQKNGLQCRVTSPVSAGDCIRVRLEESSTSSGHLLPSPDFSMPDILYEDNDVIAVNKPAGILTHPAGGHYNDTLSNQLIHYFQCKHQQVTIRPVGRLDKETSGIVLFAKNQISAARLQKQREDHFFCKEYLAVAEGSLPVDCPDIWHTIEYPVMKLSDHPVRMSAVSSGESFSELSVRYQGLYPASTHYQTRISTDIWSLVAVRLDTGRTHQIRVHMQAIGHPLLGDRLYGHKSTIPFSRAALHAWKITFQQPFTDKVITLEAPLPKDFDHLSR